MLPSPLVIVGRSSSHFTRVARIIALELEVACALQVVRDLMSTDVDDYGGNPALKIPSLRTSEGTWFGALNVSRELARRSNSTRRIVWPEQLEGDLAANAQELVLSAMSTGVSLILSKFGANDTNAAETPAQRKMRAKLSAMGGALLMACAALGETMHSPNKAPRADLKKFRRDRGMAQIS